MSTKSVFLDHEKCKVYDEFNINRCKNCCSYYNSHKKCTEKFRRPQTCYKFSENHDPNICRSEVKKCANCIVANRCLSTDLDSLIGQITK